MADTKKAYQRPQLRVYGNIRDITKTVGIGPQDDQSPVGGMQMKSH